MLSRKPIYRECQLWALVQLCVIFSLVTGCDTPSLTQVRQFASASKTLGDRTRSAIDLAVTVSDNRLLYNVAANPEQSLANSSFQGLYSRTAKQTSENAVTDRLALRLKLLDQLVAYSSALLKLAEADFDSDIDAASRELNGSLVGLRGSYKAASGNDLPLSDDDIGIVTTAVYAIGKVVAESKRAEAVKTVIMAADSAVQKATALIASDLGGGTDLSEFVTQSLRNGRGSLQQAYNIERLKPSSTFESRLALLTRAREMYEAESSAPSFFAAISGGAAAVGAAHSALRKAVESDEFSTSEGAMLIGRLEVYVRSIDSYYDGIRKVK